jgi:hypothetical protein
MSIKFIICVQIERLHRYVFDNVYVSDNRSWGARYVPRRLDKTAVRCLFILAKLFPDYRSYLRKNSTNPKYFRYTII